MNKSKSEYERMQYIAGLRGINESIDYMNEKSSPEQAVNKAVTVANKLEKSPLIDKIAGDIAKDPKALKQLQSVLSQSGVDMRQISENIDSTIIKKLATTMARKAEKLSSNISEDEEGGFDVGGAFWMGLLGGGTLAHYIFRKETFDLIGKVQYSAAMGETMAGAIAGALLAVVAKAVYDRVKRKI